MTSGKMYVIWKGGFDSKKGGIKMGDRNSNNLRYADDAI